MPSSNHTVQIALAGCGTMGRALAHAIFSGECGDARLVAVFDQDPPRAHALAESAPRALRPIAVCASVQDMVSTPALKLVVECASQSAVKAISLPVAVAGLDLLAVSSGALLDPDLAAKLDAASISTGGRVLVPSGAIGGIDAIRAVRHLLEEVTLTSTKPPAAYAGAPGFEAFKDRDFTSPVVLFEGPAKDAVPLFPANVNVAATLSLAGIGPVNTKARVVADPASPGNVHEILARGAFGEIRLKFSNRPHPENPRTSALAVYSAIETLRSYCSGGMRVGT